MLLHNFRVGLGLFGLVHSRVCIKIFGAENGHIINDSDTPIVFFKRRRHFRVGSMYLVHYSASRNNRDSMNTHDNFKKIEYTSLRLVDSRRWRPYMDKPSFRKKS